MDQHRHHLSDSQVNFVDWVLNFATEEGHTSVIQKQQQGQLQSWTSKSYILAVFRLGLKANPTTPTIIIIRWFYLSTDTDTSHKWPHHFTCRLLYVLPYHFSSGKKYNIKFSWFHFIAAKDFLAHVKAKSTTKATPYYFRYSHSGVNPFRIDLTVPS